MDLNVGRRRDGRVGLVRHDDRRPEPDHEPLGAQHHAHRAVHAAQLHHLRCGRRRLRQPWSRPRQRQAQSHPHESTTGFVKQVRHRGEPKAAFTRRRHGAALTNGSRLLKVEPHRGQFWRRHDNRRTWSHPRYGQILIRPYDGKAGPCYSAVPRATCGPPPRCRCRRRRWSPGLPTALATLERRTARIVDVSAAMRPARGARSAAAGSCCMRRRSASAWAPRRGHRRGRNRRAGRRTLSDDDVGQAAFRQGMPTSSVMTSDMQFSTRNAAIL